MNEKKKLALQLKWNDDFRKNRSHIISRCTKNILWRYMLSISKSEKLYPDTSSHVI